MSDDELVSMYKEQMELHRDRAEVYRQKLQAAEKKLEKISAAMCSEEIDRVLFFLSLRYLSDTEKVISWQSLEKKFIEMRSWIIRLSIR